MARGCHTSGAGSPEPSKFILDQSGAIVKMNEDGTAMIINAAAASGGGSLTAHALIFAEELGLNPEDVFVYPGDTGISLFDVPTHASRGTYSSGLAMKKAAEKVKKILINWAAEILEASPDDLVAKRGKIFVSRSIHKSVSIKEVVEIAQSRGWGSAQAEVAFRPRACPPTSSSASWRWRLIHRPER